MLYMVKSGAYHILNNVLNHRKTVCPFTCGSRIKHSSSQLVGGRDGKEGKSFFVKLRICRYPKKCIWAIPSSLTRGLLLQVLISIPSHCSFSDMRHPEERSLLRPVEEKKKKKDTEEEVVVYDLTSLRISSGPAHTVSNGMPVHFADSPQTEAVYKMLSVSLPAPETKFTAGVCVFTTHIDMFRECKSMTGCCYTSNTTASMTCSPSMTQSV
nr:uncharacterized protein LOC115135637 [Oncorhynchus nerka]